MRGVFWFFHCSLSSFHVFDVLWKYSVGLAAATDLWRQKKTRKDSATPVRCFTLLSSWIRGLSIFAAHQMMMTTRHIEESPCIKNSNRIRNTTENILHIMWRKKERARQGGGWTNFTLFFGFLRNTIHKNANWTVILIYSDSACLGIRIPHLLRYVEGARKSSTHTAVVVVVITRMAGEITVVGGCRERAQKTVLLYSFKVSTRKTFPLAQSAF